MVIKARTWQLKLGTTLSKRSTGRAKHLTLCSSNRRSAWNGRTVQSRTATSHNQKGFDSASATVCPRVPMASLSCSSALGQQIA